MHKVIQNKLKNKLNGSCRTLSSPNVAKAPSGVPLHVRHPLGLLTRSLSATRLVLPVSFLILLSFLYINIYVGNALMNSSALTDTYNLTVTDNPSLTVTLNPGTPISLNPTAEGVFGSQDVGVNVM
ncbi:hypothetical protein IKG68_01245, partial [Candidatus Saccharibacteria bacterium]|nr:hypothetical protein [Candidatus Saccharibacteria bacterium]